MATPREKRLTLVAAVLGTSVFLDATVISVALPATRLDLVVVWLASSG